MRTARPGLAVCARARNCAASSARARSSAARSRPTGTGVRSRYATPAAAISPVRWSAQVLRSRSTGAMRTIPTRAPRKKPARPNAGFGPAASSDRANGVAAIRARRTSLRCRKRRANGSREKLRMSGKPCRNGGGRASTVNLCPSPAAVEPANDAKRPIHAQRLRLRCPRYRPACDRYTRPFHPVPVRLTRPACPRRAGLFFSRCDSLALYDQTNCDERCGVRSLFAVRPAVGIALGFGRISARRESMTLSFGFERFVLR